MDAGQKSNITAKVISYLTYVLLPVVLGNIVYWSHAAMIGKEMSWKVRTALMFGSLGIASGVHVVCTGWTYEWLAMWFCGIFSKQLLEFLYVEFWDMFKVGIKAWLKEAIKFTDKKT